MKWWGWIGIWLAWWILQAFLVYAWAIKAKVAEDTMADKYTALFISLVLTLIESSFVMSWVK
jgi:hypothetical protein